MEAGDIAGKSKRRGSPIRTYGDLVVWQKSMAFVTGVYKAIETFPKEEQFGLVSQMRQCAVSIPSNVAEGYGRSREIERMLSALINKLSFK